MAKTSVWARRKARRALLQALYQWQLNATPFPDLYAQFSAGEALKKADAEFFQESLRRVLREAQALDEQIEPMLDRRLSELDQVERALLRLGTDELANRIEVPFKVVIDEYVELAKSFGAEESHKYINGVLDRLARELRPLETSSSA